MRVHGPHDPTQHNLHAVRDASQQGKKASSPDASRSAVAATATGQQHVAAPELARLADQLRSADESREGLVRDAARRFAQGDYGTRETAERVAAIIAEGPFGGLIRGI